MKIQLKTIVIAIGVALLMAWNINCFGQDTVFVRIGKPIAAKVIEIAATTVKYKRSDNPDGPVYTFDKSDISFIRYHNGSVDSFPQIKPWLKPVVAEEPAYVKPANNVVSEQPKIQPIGKVFLYKNQTFKANEIFALMKEKNNPEINDHIFRAKLAKAFDPVTVIGIPAIVLGCVLTAESQSDGFFSYGVTNSQRKQNQNLGTGLIILSAACLATSITLKIKYKTHMKRAVDLYNQAY